MLDETSIDGDGVAGNNKHVNSVRSLSMTPTPTLCQSLSEHFISRAVQ